MKPKVITLNLIKEHVAVKEMINLRDVMDSIKTQKKIKKELRNAGLKREWIKEECRKNLE